MLRIIIMSLLLVLSGCSALTIDTKPIDKLPLNISDPAALKLLPVKFTVVTKESAGAVFAEMEAAKAEPVLFGLSGNDYKALSSNVEVIKQYIILQKEILSKYRNYYEPKTK